MTDDKIKEKRIIEIVTLIVGIIAIIIAVWQLTVLLKKREELPINGNGPPENGNGPIIGIPQIWTFGWIHEGDITTMPKGVYIPFSSVPIRLDAITGWVDIQSIDPGDWFEKDIAYEIRAVKSNGTRVRLNAIDETGQLTYDHATGYEVGIHSFTASPAISDIVGLDFVITRHYGFGSDNKRFFEISLDALVLIT